MDPKEAYKRVLAGEPGAAQDLIDWLERGGALPVPTNNPRFSRAAFISGLRKLAK